MTEQMAASDPEVVFLVQNASRLVTVATRCLWSFGSADGLNDILASPTDPHGDWRQPVAVLHRDAVLMAALRIAVLLDADPKLLSFQSFYRRLTDAKVQTALLQFLEARIGPDVFTPSRAEKIDDFVRAYREIDWKAHGRLTNLRNQGIAHLTLDALKKSVTIEELRMMVGIIGRLAAEVQSLFQLDSAFRSDMDSESRDRVKAVIVTTWQP
ncbi:hypothetical protein AB7645_05435 [Bradyrhizobium sp. 956_D2_N1_5]|uniref:hypothetical protein n=1 Tax=unclassified Bradyrhizobium TaxID=2631580 RepID=UPI003F20ACA2